jgi:SAM-dependent methyltransferase
MSCTPVLQAATPDLTRLAAWPASQWRTLEDRLRSIGLDETNLEMIGTVLPNMLPRLANPLRRWLLRQKSCEYNYAARLLMLGDNVEREQAESAFGAELLESMLVSSLLVANPDGTLSSPFRLSLVNGRYILADDLRHGGDAVMGSGNTTLGLIEAVYGERLGRVLDLGCGAGAMALALSQCAESVIATDINPRALMFGQINAAINGVENVEFREGDLYEPVQHDTFDLIVSQPPFIPMPEGSASTTYLYGGPRGDELPLRVMAGTAEHLRNGGRAVILIQWPELEGESLNDRVRNAVGAPEADLLLVAFPPLDLNTFCLMYSSHIVADLGEQFEIDVMKWRQHFARMKVGSMRHCFNIVRKDAKELGWTKAVFPAMGVATREAIDKVLARYDLLAADDDTLLRARLRIRNDAVLVAEEPLGNDGEPKLQVGFTRSVMNRPAEVNDEMLDLLRAVHGTESVRAGIRVYSDENDSRADILDAVKEALELGLLEVAGE